jgi:hypothetical protein
MKIKKQKNMKGEFMMRILETLGNATLGVVDLVDVMLTAGYGVSQTKFRRELEQRQTSRAQKAAIQRMKQERIREEKETSTEYICYT